MAAFWHAHCGKKNKALAQKYHLQERKGDFQ
jgi:hypothetical protein